MRMIDAAHFWSSRTLEKYYYMHQRYRGFTSAFGIPEQLHHNIKHPPCGPIIPLLWSMEHYTLQPSRRDKSAFVSFNTSRGLRSALSSWLTWTTSLDHPEHAYRDSDKRTHSGPNVVPTDGLAASLTISGMAKRLGTASRPSVALLQHHVLWNQAFRSARYHETDPNDLLGRYNWAAANVVECLAWLGWLRSDEVFSTEWDDVSVTHPDNHAEHNFPPGAGAAFLRLLDSTKSDQTKQADLVLAYSSSAGLKLGFWLEQLKTITDALGWSDGPLFRHADGTPWDSHYFRHTHLYPLLTLQRLAGDAYLKPYDGSPGNTFAEKFYSMHSYRSGGRSNVNKKRLGCVRKATPPEVSEHGRWRRKHMGGETMEVHYTQWSYEDRLYITLLCM